MKILLLGEYSNVHNTLAKGLRQLGHEVVVASNGDFWKNYPRDIDISRPNGPLAGLRLWIKVLRNLRKFRGFDIVQIINPLFLELKAERHFPIFDYLKKHNKKVILGAFGLDYYWVSQGDNGIFRYGDFNIGDIKRTDPEAEILRKDWIGTAKGELSKYCADKADAIVTGLYEYDACYRPIFPDKTTFIPFPIIPCEDGANTEILKTGHIIILIGVSRNRSVYKGTDIMLRAAEDLKEKYGDKVILNIAEGLPFEEYQKLMFGSDAILDQLYSYTPAMNALEAMNHGVICVGGGEPENYEILGETELRPIINVLPTYESVYAELEKLVQNLSVVPELKKQSIEYIVLHHDYVKVAQQYIDLYESLS